MSVEVTIAKRRNSKEKTVIHHTTIVKEVGFMEDNKLLEATVNKFKVNKEDYYLVSKIRL
mgnify:CR=1 FL=1